MTESPSLAFDLKLADLYRRDGLARLDGRFVDVLKERDADLHHRLMAARAAQRASEDARQRVDDQVAGKAESELIVELAPVLEDFIAELFGVASDTRALESRHDALAPLYTVKRLFVQRRAAKKYGPAEAAGFDGDALRAELEPLLGGDLTELRFAQQVDAWMKAEAENTAALASEASGQRGDSKVRAHSASKDARKRAGDTRPEPGSSAHAPLELAARYAAWATHTPQGRARHKGGLLFK